MICLTLAWTPPTVMDGVTMTTKTGTRGRVLNKVRMNKAKNELLSNAWARVPCRRKHFRNECMNHDNIDVLIARKYLLYSTLQCLIRGWLQIVSNLAVLLGKYHLKCSENCSFQLLL